MTHELREVAVRLGALEGPVWTNGGSLVVTSLSRGLLYQIDDQMDEAGPQVLAETGGGPNGLAEGSDGSIWVAQNGGAPMASRSLRKVTPSIQRVRDGQVEDLVTSGLDAPNDCVFAPDGRLWFTDPRGGLAGADPTPGRVCALDPTTLRLEVLTDGPLYPNGLAFGLDPEDFYLAESSTGRVLHARRRSDGIGELEVFAELPDGAPDGMAVDRQGNLLVAGGGANAVYVFDPAGALIDTIEVGGTERVMVTNLCFGGDDGDTLFITVFKGGRVFACHWTH
jgi:gluconolactonase